MMKTSAKSRIERHAAVSLKGAAIYTNVFFRFQNGFFCRYMMEWSREKGWYVTHAAPEKFRNFRNVTSEFERVTKANFLIDYFYPNPETFGPIGY